MRKIKTDTRVISTKNNVKMISMSSFNKGGSICEFCSNDQCDERGQNQECETLTFPIAFAPLAQVGFKGVFNTFRPGAAWEKRLNSGDKISFIDSKSQTKLSDYKVNRVLTLPLDEALRLHAHNNHMAKEHVSEAEAEEYIRGILLKFYGPRIIHSECKVSVIYCEE